MILTFFGGIREVTGSMHLLTTPSDRILLDCGMFQGRRKTSEEKNRNLPFAAKLITNMVLSHAHIDHSGRIPLLVKNGFSGRIFCTRPTADACEYLLLDSAHIQESDAQYLNYKAARNLLRQMKTSPRTRRVSKKEVDRIQNLLKKSAHELNTETINTLMEQHNLHSVQPLYTTSDAELALTFFDGHPYRQSVSIGQDTTCEFFDAGHILGSALTLLKSRENGKLKNILYTGDIGRFNKPIIDDPALIFPDQDREIDLMIMESTYGDRLHASQKDNKQLLKEVLIDTASRGGTLLIPAFAYGRTQELIYYLHELYDAGDVPKIPVYVDSPLALNITKVFGEHPEVYDRQTHETFLEHGKNPFSFRQIHFVRSVEESMILMRDEKPHVVISASGMCEAGRILHHLRYKIHDSKNTVLIVGFMAQNTLGRRILELGAAFEAAQRKGDPPLVNIFNKSYPLRARVVKLDGFSAHGDKAEMTRFLKTSNLKIKQVALVHGEEEQTLAFAEHLKTEGFNVLVPQQGESIQIR
ncbi:MAG: MBL fold metallo-hydrolase [Desulfobacterales bacterium]|nr:MBL fold metallo-hydrolase [Desulfobacterales bacterium]